MAGFVKGDVVVVPSLLRDIKAALSRVYGDDLRGIYLYGSYALGDEDPESDLDLVIVLRDFEDYWEEVCRTGALISELSLKYEVSISPIRVREAVWKGEDAPFLNRVRKEAVPL